MLLGVCKFSAAVPESRVAGSDLVVAVTAAGARAVEFPVPLAYLTPFHQCVLSCRFNLVLPRWSMAAASLTLIYRPAMAA